MSNWPQCTAKFGSKKPCSSCGITWVSGVKLYKINEEYWCSNPDCPKKKAETIQREEQSSSHVDSKLGAVSKERIAYHDHAWEIALAKATKIYPPVIEKTKRWDGTITDVDDNLKNRMILAQVFYKGLMGISS